MEGIEQVVDEGAADRLAVPLDPEMVAIAAYHEALFKGDDEAAGRLLRELLHPTADPLTDSEAGSEFNGVRAKFGQYVSGPDRPIDDDDKPLPPTVTLDGRFTLKALRAVLAIMERVQPCT